MIEKGKDSWRTRLRKKWLRMRSTRRRMVIVGSAVFALLMICALAYPSARRVYRKHHEESAVKRAELSLEAGDLRSASVSAREALLINPRNLRACRVMAHVAAIARVPQALDWQVKIAELCPTFEEKLAVAATAVQFESPPCAVAARTLKELETAGKGSVPYHLLSARLAIRLNRPGVAEEHFRQASLLEPTNELHQFNLASLRLGSTNEASARAARATLEQLKANTNFSFLVHRWLANDEVRRGQWQAAEKSARELLADPRVELEDRLQYLHILHRRSAADFAATLKALQTVAATNPPQIYTLTKWMIAHQMAEPAFTWLQSLPPKMQEVRPVKLATAEYYATAKRWNELDTYLEEQEWGDLEFVRWALLSCVAAGQQRDLAAQSNWRLALRQAGGLGSLISLLQFSQIYDLPAARREELLWEIGGRFPRETWALQELIPICARAGNTTGLNRIFTSLFEANPADPMVKNDFAATSMLLKVNLSRAYQVAQELYNANPEDPMIASTYAFSLYLQKKPKAGRAVLEKLKPEALKNPTLALYYALLLDADGQIDKAISYAELSQGAHLLPEEQELRKLVLKP